jgi:hypothetical protein
VARGSDPAALDRLRGVVAPDAVDAADLEHLAFAEIGTVTIGTGKIGFGPACAAAGAASAMPPRSSRLRQRARHVETSSSWFCSLAWGLVSSEAFLTKRSAGQCRNGITRHRRTKPSYSPLTNQFAYI